MKKSTLKLAFLSLMMTAMLFNCKDKDDTDPTKPDDNITKELDNLNIATPTLDKAATVPSTTSSVEASAKATEVSGALAGISASGTVPASVSTAASDVKGALSDSEISTLTSISPETISAVSAGGAMSPELQAIYTKAMANPALAAYFPKFNLPTVNGAALKATRIAADAAKSARTAGTEAIEKVEKVLVDDACIAAAEATFQSAKTRLDGQRATAIAAVTAQYQADIAPIAAAQTACTSTATTTSAGYRTSAAQAAATANASLDAAQGVLGDLYPVLKALVAIQYIGALSSINELEAADKQACIAIAAATTTNAAAAQTANTAKVDAVYLPAIAQATALRTSAIASCHNQGGGN